MMVNESKGRFGRLTKPWIAVRCTGAAATLFKGESVTMNRSAFCYPAILLSCATEQDTLPHELGLRKEEGEGQLKPRRRRSAARDYSRCKST